MASDVDGIILVWSDGGKVSVLYFRTMGPWFVDMAAVYSKSYCKPR